MAPHLKLMLGGDMVEYLFGEEEVFVEAEQLLDGTSTLEEVDYEPCATISLCSTIMKS